MRLDYKNLYRLYAKRHKSASEISDLFGCSEGKINYWLAKYRIQKRNISEAVYVRHNPSGDPFVFKKPRSIKEAELFGMGIGLYWGEGTKASKTTVKLGNTDPALIKVFISFLIKTFNIKKKDLRFHLQIFSDVSPKDSINFWTKKLNIKKSQLYKPTITKSGKIGTYRQKSKFGVLTVYYFNSKLKKVLINLLPM